jgi:hypothetical protein
MFGRKKNAPTAILSDTNQGYEAILSAWINSPEYQGTRAVGTDNTAPHSQGNIQYQAHAGNTPYYPVQVYNGLTQPDAKAVLSQGAQIIERRPFQFRRFNNLGYADVQIKNGLWNGVGKGIMFTPYPVGQAFVPSIPGQTRGDVGGFHKRGPSTYNIEDMLASGPGSQPEHPGGPGTIAGTTLYNPMSG